MDDAQRVAFINAQTVCALAEIEGMKAENTYRVNQGYTIAYGYEAFEDVPLKYGIDHNSVISYLRGF